MDLFQLYGGTDITKRLNINRNVFLTGRKLACETCSPSERSTIVSHQCLFANGILLVLAVIISWLPLLVLNFLASVNFAAARALEDHDKFIIWQVPCYTEGDTSLRRTIDSLAQMKNDNKRKLLHLWWYDRSTPRIILDSDILGADPNLDPEFLSFVSLGEGAKQHNMGKVLWIVRMRWSCRTVPCPCQDWKTNGAYSSG